MPRGRPQIPVGTYGKIGFTEFRTKNNKITVRAHTIYRFTESRSVRVTRRGQTQTAAERALKVALREIEEQTRADTIGPQTTVAKLADAWLAEPHPWRDNSREKYERIITTGVAPAIGDLPLSAVRASTVNRLIAKIRDTRGNGPALHAKRALSGMFRLAVMNDAMPGNPALGTVSISQQRRTVRALTRDEEAEMCDRLRSSERAHERDLPDLAEFMLGTGCRIGEALAASLPVLDLEAGTWEINATAVRVTGKGLYIQPRPKTAAGWRVIVLPSFAVQMVQRRQNELRWPAPGGVVFGNPTNKALRDPSNATGDLRHVLDEIGFEWVTSHVFRKTVATRLDEAGWTARQIADHLGHARPSMTMDVYMGRRVVNADAARVLDR